MHIPTRAGLTLAHQGCSWLCTPPVHAVVVVGEEISTVDEVTRNGRLLGLDVVEVLPGREVDILAFARDRDAWDFDGRRLSPAAAARQPKTKAWVLRCRVAEERRS